MVECESPSDDAAAVNRFVELVCRRRRAHRQGARRIPAGASAAPGLRVRAAREEEERADAGARPLRYGVAVGTLKTMPFRERDGRLWGPGVLDMKAGIAFFIFAVRALRELDMPVRAAASFCSSIRMRRWAAKSRARSPSATPRRSKAVLVLEPGTGLEGKLKTARKGVGDYYGDGARQGGARGRRLHGRRERHPGTGAADREHRRLHRTSTRGITVNPGVISGGTRSNVVAAEARAEIDIRVRAAQGRRPRSTASSARCGPSTSAARSRSPAA